MCTDFMLSEGPPATVNEFKNCVSCLMKPLCVFLPPHPSCSCGLKCEYCNDLQAHIIRHHAQRDQETDTERQRQWQRSACMTKNLKVCVDACVFILMWCPYIIIQIP